MSNPVKEQLTSDFHKVKSVGGTKASRIREIFQSAATQAMNEMKDGSVEIGGITKETLFTVTENLNGQTLDPEATSETTIAQDMSFKTLVMNLLKAIKTRMFAQATQEYAQVKQKAVEMDGKLGEQYGDRYATAKQGLQKMETWYNTAKAKLETLDADVLQQKQSEFETKVGEVGSSMAKTEQAVRQQLKNMLHVR